VVVVVVVIICSHRLRIW